MIPISCSRNITVAVAGRALEAGRWLCLRLWGHPSQWLFHPGILTPKVFWFQSVTSHIHGILQEITTRCLISPNICLNFRAEWFFTIFTHCATPNVQMNLETSKPSPATFILRATFLDPLLMEYLCPFSSSHLEFDFDLTHSSSRSSTSITLHTTLLKWHKSFGTCD